MMREVFIEADNIISPIGLTTDENFRNLTQGISGIQSHEKQAFSATPFHASLFNELTLPATEAGFTKFENILIASIQNALQQSQVNLADPTTVMIISTTKGNVSLLETEDSKGWNEENISLHHSAQKIADHFGYKGLPVVISNACISGLAAMLLGKRLIESGQYQNAVVAGADMITKFVLSGFQSFQAVSDEPCRPFDESRKGITLGEAAATVILTTQKGTGLIRFSGGAVSNDANHISGPSRSGEELS
ncbi:MAG: beta-ketoacyl synthase, partial [Gemmatimonadaceae bacterium]|nr:beta-ketoacyl synthase [Chitinophagaceae bacterium]